MLGGELFRSIKNVEMHFLCVEFKIMVRQLNYVYVRKLGIIPAFGS